MTPTDKPDASERVRRYFDSCCRPGKDRRLEDSIDNDLRAVAVAYLAQSPTYAEQSAEIADWKRKHDELFWIVENAHRQLTDGGISHTIKEPGDASLAKRLEWMAAELAELRAERNMLMTALDGLLNDFIKAVPSSEPIDCAKFTRYQPALLAYVTVRDRKPLDGLGVRA